jgi:hypothetical protein
MTDLWWGCIVLCGAMGKLVMNYCCKDFDSCKNCLLSRGDILLRRTPKGAVTNGARGEAKRPKRAQDCDFRISRRQRLDFGFCNSD